MVEPFRTRGSAVPPQLRTFRKRRAVRVVVLAGEAEGGALVLMFHDRDPGVPGSGWWVLPGGGIDEDETSREAARRELAEESGYLVHDAELYGPVARRVVLHGYSDQVTEQSEEIFLVNVRRPYEIDISGHTDFERISVQGHAWLRIDAPLDDPVWPTDLARLLAITREPDSWPVDLGLVEESVVAVALGYGTGSGQTGCTVA